MKYLIVILMILGLQLQTNAQSDLPVEELLAIMYDEAGVKAHDALGLPLSSTTTEAPEATNELVGANIHYEFDDCAVELTFLSEEKVSMRTIYPQPAYERALSYTLSHLDNGEELVEFINAQGQKISYYHDFNSQSVTLLIETSHWADIAVGTFSLETVTVR